MKNKTGKIIFAAILLFSFWFAFNSVAYAQTPTPPSWASLIQEIQIQAQNDAKFRSAPQNATDLAVLFEERADALVPPMLMSDVQHTYDEAYKAATPVKSPWDDLLKPQGGWIFLIIGGLLVILANIAKDYLTVFFKKLAEAAYQRLARFRPFWMIALRRYRKSLEATYHELKIPFRQGRPLQMQDVYVPVRVDGGDKQQVDAYQTIQKQKRLVVLGDPGSGKTMLLRHITFTYARQGLYDFPGQPIPVYLELNRVESAENSLLNALSKTLENHNFPGADGFLMSALENKSLLILLDGLDEVNAPSRPELIKQVKDLYQKYPENRIIITCRKAVYQGEMDDWVDQKLEIIEFSDQQIQRFMTSWQKDMPADKSIEHFIRTLQERPQIMALARNPLLLTMVAYLYTDTEFALPHSRSEFYSRSTDLLLDQWKLERNRYKATHKRIVLQRLALFNQSQSGKTGERRTLEIADVLKEIRDVLPDLTLKTEDALPLLDEIIHRSGLMLVIDSGTHYQFTHLTLQEYFAARALETDQKKLLDFYRANPDAWREVVRIWCSFEHDSTAMLKELYVLDPVMAFECLSDAQQVDNTYADELIQKFKPRLLEALINDSLASAFALLAADPRPRGKKWFEFVKGNLSDEQYRLAACTVLARTNIPQAAEPLAKFSATNPNIVPFITQLGNLAVSALTKPAQDGEIWAMDALVDIGTPLTALVLEPLLWSDEPKAYHAAWRLAALLSLPGVEDILQTITIVPEYREAKLIGWIWEPFSDDTTLRSVIGRIAYLLQSTPETLLSSKSLLCDSRLALPICAIVLNVYQNVDNDVQKQTKEQLRESFISKEEIKKSEQQLLDNKKSTVDNFSKHLGKHLQSLFFALNVNAKFDLLYRLAFEKEAPSVDDWRNLFTPVSYKFSTSWNVIVLKLLLLLLLPINLWGIWNQISQSADLISLKNGVSVLVGIVALVGIMFLQTKKITWNTSDLGSIVLVVLIGSGAFFGGVLINPIHNWIMSILIGNLICALILLFMYRGGLTSKSITDFLNKEFTSPLLGCIFVTTLIIALSVLGDIEGSLLISALIFALVVLVVRVNNEKEWVKLSISDNLETTFVISMMVMVGFTLVFSLMYFSSKLLFEITGLSVTLLFWFIWLSCFYLVYFIGKRLERRAQNPLYGLLEASGTRISSLRSSRWLARWFRLR